MKRTIRDFIVDYQVEYDAMAEEEEWRDFLETQIESAEQEEDDE